MFRFPVNIQDVTDHRNLQSLLEGKIQSAFRRVGITLQSSTKYLPGRKLKLKRPLRSTFRVHQEEAVLVKEEPLQRFNLTSSANAPADPRLDLRRKYTGPAQLSLQPLYTPEQLEQAKHIILKRYFPSYIDRGLQNQHTLQISCSG
jgi:hypothetical protein